ncbi:MAG: PD-(D/E)XK nuclease family protein [Pseudomonadota bacterium]
MQSYRLRTPTIVCRGRRLARALKARWADTQQEVGAKAWLSPAIFALETYQLRLWARVVSFTDARHLLSEGAAKHLFLDVVNDHVPTYIDGVATTGDALYRSYRMAVEWCIDVDMLRRTAVTNEQQLLAAVVGRYRQRLDESGWLDPAGLSTALLAADIPSDELPQAGFTLAGFVALSPLQERFFTHWQDRGCPVERYSSELDRSPTVTVRRVADDQDEWLQAGDWARAQLEAQPSARVAIVVPGLASVAQTAPALIADALTPGWQLDESAAAIHTSLGRSLLGFPLIAAWFRPFARLGQRYRFAELTELLRDAVLLPANALADCAKLERALRAEPERRWALNELRERLDGGSAAHTVLQILCDIEAEFADADEVNSLRHWVSRLAAMAERVAVLGDGAVDSTRFQLTNAWRQSLNALADLDVVEPRVDGRRAISLWRRLLASTVFQTDDAGSRLDVLGPLEIIGDRYDAIWVARLDDENWPPNTQADPFINRRLQASLQMPGTDRARDATFAAQLLDQLVAVGSTAVLSAPLRRGDVALHLAPGVARRIGNATEPARESLDRFDYSTRPDAEWVSEAVVAVRADETLRGGVGLVAAALEVPFLAFARYRLGAEPLQPALRGLGPCVRGNVLHHAAEIAVPARPNDDLAAAAATAVGRYRRHADRLLHRLLDAEEQRTIAILGQLAEFDRGRGDFDVLDVEAPVELRLGALTLALRIDRLDRVDEQAVLIDYKTGLRVDGQIDASTGLPRQLQLAAYVLALRQQRSDMLFGASAAVRLHTRGVVADGVAFTAGLLPLPRRARQDEAVIETWEGALTDVADSITRGDVTVRRDALDDPSWSGWRVLLGGIQ